MKGKRRTAATITLMTILAVVILITYYYWTHRTEPLSSEENLTEVQKLVNKDLDLYYPGTPREVVRLFASMMQALYNNPKDKDIGALAVKIRELYDQEFLDNNPEDAYLSNLDSELKEWKEKSRKITNYILVNEVQGKESEIDGEKYATEYISFTIQENSKSTEIWNVLLRQAADGQWKILGWEPVSEDTDINGKK